jgi:hypothetical protein
MNSTGRRLIASSSIGEIGTPLPGRRYRRPVLGAAGPSDDGAHELAASGFVRRFAGRVETGRDGISDPAMATDLD